MKCRMLQNAIVTVPCTRYTIPNTVPILFLPHFHLFVTYVFPQILSLLAQPQSYYPFSGDLPFLQVFSNAAFIQPSPLRTPFRLQSLSITPHPLVPDLLAQWVLMFSSLALSLLLFHFLSVPSPVLITLPASLLPKPAKVHKTSPPGKVWPSARGLWEHTELMFPVPNCVSKPRMTCNNPDWKVTEESCSPWRTFLRELSHKALQFLPRTVKVSFQWLLAWFVIARGICPTPKGQHHNWCQAPNTKDA